MSSPVKYWLQISSFVAFVLFLIASRRPFIYNVQPSPLRLPNVPAADLFRAPKHNIWADLSREEGEDILEYLFSKSNLNLTESSRATSNDNSVVLLELLQPNKTDVLAYLNGVSGPPQRWARVVVAQGVTTEAKVVNYMVGPLPPSNSTKTLPLDFCYSSGRNYVVNPMPSNSEFQAWAVTLGMNVSDITQELLGDQFDPLDGNSLALGARFSSMANGTLVVWTQFYRHVGNSNAISLLPQGLYLKIEAPTRDSSNWKVHQWYYNHVLYESASELRDAMKRPNFQKNTLNLDGDWTDTVDFSEGPPGRQEPPPVIIQPGNARFKIDKKQNFVSWMGFEFFITTSSDSGLSLHNIRFNGDSVIYELGLQEALAHYAGDDPIQGGQEFLDTSFDMGLRMFELVPGYDCPAYATFLSTTYHVGGSLITKENSICIFEYTADHALQRHTSSSRVSISRNTYLVVRAVSTVGNYDYTFDYIFYLDGTIEVKVRASGFIFAAFWTGNTANEYEYGYRVHDAISTSMHDHVLNFKADLDVAGTANTLMRVGVEPTTLEFPWDDQNTRPRNTMHLRRRPVVKECGISWPSNSGEMFIVVNSNATNAWGEKRGYRIQPGTGIGNPAHLAILNSTALGKSAAWASQDLWVLKRKDTEPRSASALNSLSPMDPLVDFSKFVNEEEIVQDDLVVYFNLGMHHVPHSGDIPNTLMHNSASSVMFTPFNFHDRDPSRRSSQGVSLELGANEAKAGYFGGRYQEGVKLKETDLEPDLSKYDSPHQAAKTRSWMEKFAAPWI